MSVICVFLQYYGSSTVRHYSDFGGCQMVMDRMLLKKSSLTSSLIQLAATKRSHHRSSHCILVFTAHEMQLLSNDKQVWCAFLGWGGMGWWWWNLVILQGRSMRGGGYSLLLSWLELNYNPSNHSFVAKIKHVLAMSARSAQVLKTLALEIGLWLYILYHTNQSIYHTLSYFMVSILLWKLS